MATTTATLTNKTLTSPIISTITNGSATLTLPTTSGTVALTSQLGSGGISESDNLEFTITGFPFEVDGVGYSGCCGGGLQAQSWRFSGSGFNNYATTSDNVQPRINSLEQIRFGVFAHNSITGQVTQKSINGYSPNIEFVFTVRVSAYK